MATQKTDSFPTIDLKSTGSFDVSATAVGLPRPGASAIYDEVVEGLAVPAMVLDGAGIALSVNAAFSDLVAAERSALVGEPFLIWLGRSAEREAFGREFTGLRRRSSATHFSREVEIRALLGTPTRCQVRVGRLQSGSFLLTVSPIARAVDIDVEFGRAVTRALDALDQGVLLLDGEGRVVHANPYARTLLGGVLIGRGFAELATPSEVEAFARSLALARAGSWHAEVDLVRTDGDTIPVELSVAAGSGQGMPAVVLFRDLRAQRRRQFDERLTAQVDRALLSSAEPRDSVTAACRALARGLGARRVAVLTHFGGGWERWDIEPEASARFGALPPGAAAPAEWGEGVAVEMVDVDDPVIAILFGASQRGDQGLRLLLRAPGGVVGHMLTVFPRTARVDERDVALIQQIASQLALGLANGMLMLETRALAAYQARVLDQTTVMVNSVDRHGRVRTWNRASEQLFGVSVQAATGREFGSDVASAADPSRWRELWDELNREGVVTTEIELLGVGNARVPVHLEGRLLREGREVTGAVFVGLDLRSHKALQDQMLRSQKLAAVGLLAAGIAHEINNPLTGVVGYAKLLLDKPLPDEVRERVERIAASGERCRKIVEGVLLFSRQQGGARGAVDVRKIVERVVTIGEYQWRMHNVRVVKEMPAEAMVAWCDADQIEQVLLNLLSNAADAMPRGGTVYVQLAREAGDRIALSVSDEGVGIPEEIQTSIFDPFFSTKELGRGTGLGLAISYGIVRDHGGDIVLQSEVGRGSTFTVSLPVSEQPVAGTGPRTRG